MADQDKKPAVLLVGALGMCTFFSLACFPPLPRALICVASEISNWNVNGTDTTGFLGRHLALYIYQNNLASELRLVDRRLPQLAWLAPEFEPVFTPERYVQADPGVPRMYMHCPHTIRWRGRGRTLRRKRHSLTALSA